VAGLHGRGRRNIRQQISNHHRQVAGRKSAENLIIHRDRRGLIASAEARRAADFHVLLGDLPGRAFHRAPQFSRAPKMTGHILANADVHAWRWRQAEMRIGTSDSVKAIQRNIDFFGERPEFFGRKIAELTLNLS
jgi:hypothetical protein